MKESTWLTAVSGIALVCQVITGKPEFMVGIIILASAAAICRTIEGLKK